MRNTPRRHPVRPVLPHLQSRISPFLFLLLTAGSAFAVGPTLVHPASSGTEHVSLPYFDWDDFTSHPYVGSYEIQIDDSSSFASPVASATIPALISFYSPHEELAAGTWYWRVRYQPATGAPSDWSQNQFTIGSAYVVDVVDTDGWTEIRAKLATALAYGELNGQFVELRFPENETFHLEQDYDALDESTEYLFHVQDYDNLIINGRGSTLVIRATGPTCGLFFAQAASHLQLKDLTLDYETDSLSQFGGTIVAIDDDGIGDTGHRDAVTNIPTPASGTGTRGFTVEVDPAVYQNLAEFASYDTGFFVDAAHHQRIGRQGVAYTMTETWQDARIGSSDQYYFQESSSTWWNRYAGELKVGDHFVSTERGGDVILLFNNVNDFVANGVTALGSRGRYFIVRKENSTFNRSIDNHFLRTQDRIVGGPSGGVNNHGSQSWYEGTTFEWTRDDSFHTTKGSEVVLLNSAITGAFRNSAWIQDDRSWVEGNTISHAGTDAIALGGSGIDSEYGDDTQVDVALIKNNTILSPRQAGIVSRPPGDGAPVSNNQYVTVTGNTVRDHQSDEALLLDYLADSTVSNNKVESTGVLLYPFNAAWRLYSDPALQIGIHVEDDAEDLSGTGNEVTDPRILCADRLVVEPGASNISLGLSGPSSGLHESWRCASVSAFTAPGTLAGDQTWTINANNFKVEVLDSTPLGSRSFGRTTSDVLPGKSATALDTHTTVLPQTLTPGTKGIRLQARFVFNALTTSGRGDVRFGVENSSTGQLYAVGLSATTTASPVTFYGVSTGNAADVGTAGDQTTSGVWQVDATFRRVSSTSTTVTYTVTRPNGSPYTGTANLSAAVGTSATFDEGSIAFKQRGQVIFDWIQVTAVD